MIGQLINVLIYLLVIGIVLWLVIYVVDNVPIPEPFRGIIRVVAIVICGLVAILALLRLVGVDTGFPVIVHGG